MFNRNIKMSKEWATVLMIAGAIMCIYGVVYVIPTKGAFGLIWTLVAGLIVIFSGMNVFGKGFSIYRIDSDDSDNYSSKYSVSEKSLEIIQRLYDQHLISEEEYEQLRRDIQR